MRQRKPKNLEQKLQNCSEYMIQDLKNPMASFPVKQPTYLEIGCGKGNFIIKKALENPDKNFIAIEGQDTVILRALEKAMAHEGGIPNLRFMLTFVQTMDEFFEEGQLAGVYLNFSDPWPKARHAKRRLTYRDRLRDYKWAIADGGFIEFKTDNDGLYDFTLEEIEESGFVIAEQTRDLHNSPYESQYTMTEYEAKFKDKGKNINYVKIAL